MRVPGGCGERKQTVAIAGVFAQGLRDRSAGRARNERKPGVVTPRDGLNKKKQPRSKWVKAEGGAAVASRGSLSTTLRPHRHAAALGAAAGFADVAGAAPELGLRPFGGLGRARGAAATRAACAAA